MTTRVTRRKEKAARRRSMRIQRGGVDLSEIETTTLINYIKGKLGRELKEEEEQKLSKAIKDERAKSHIFGSIGTNAAKETAMLRFVTETAGITLDVPPAASSISIGGNNSEEAGGAAAAGDVVSEKQEGAEAAPPDQEYKWYKEISENRRAEWIKVVKDHPILRSSLGILLGAQEGNKAEAYITLLAQQDEVFDLAFKIIEGKLKEEIGDDVSLVTTADILPHATEIKAASPDMIPYIKDAALFITLAEDKIDPKHLTKLQKITQGETTKADKADIFELMLYPKRLQNMFITGLADIIVMLRDPSNNELLKEDYAKDILVKHYRARVQELALKYTVYPLRDGFFMNQSITDFDKSMDSFWYEFMSGLEKSVVFDITDPSCNYINNKKWGTLTANICNMYFSGAFDEDKSKGEAEASESVVPTVASDMQTEASNYYLPLIKLFNKLPCNENYYEDEDHKKFYPPESVLEQKLFGTDTTLKQLFSQVANTTFEYMVHLVHAIKKCEKEKAEQAAKDKAEQAAEEQDGASAPAATPSLVPGHPNSQGNGE